MLGSGLTAWMRSTNLMASWMKKTGMLLPTISIVGETRGGGQRAVEPDKTRMKRTPVSLFSVEPDGESSNVSDGIGGSSRSGDGGESSEDGSGARGVIENSSLRELRDGGVKLEGPVSCDPSGVDDSLGDPKEGEKKEGRVD